MANRPIINQPWGPNFSLTVLTTPTAIDPSGAISKLINSFVVSVPAGAANNVFIGDGNVSLTNGMEIVAGGGPVSFEIMDERVQYELKEPMIRTAEVLGCKSVNDSDIPIVVWDLSQVYMIAVANTVVSITPFKKQFV